jgi:hypothetical protein
MNLQTFQVLKRRKLYDETMTVQIDTFPRIFKCRAFYNPTKSTKGLSNEGEPTAWTEARALPNSLTRRQRCPVAVRSTPHHRLYYLCFFNLRQRALNLIGLNCSGKFSFPPFRPFLSTKRAPRPQDARAWIKTIHMATKINHWVIRNRFIIFSHKGLNKTCALTQP